VRTRKKAKILGKCLTVAECWSSFGIVEKLVVEKQIEKSEEFVILLVFQRVICWKE